MDSKIQITLVELERAPGNLGDLSLESNKVLYQYRPNDSGAVDSDNLLVLGWLSHWDWLAVQTP